MVSKKIIHTNLCIIGGGAGGLTLAAAAGQLGINTILLENNHMGGDCLNSGCVPSKSLIAAAQVAKQQHHAHQFGIANQQPDVDFAAVTQHIKTVIDGIAEHDSVDRFNQLGVQVMEMGGYFINDHLFLTDDNTSIIAKRFVIATGSQAMIPAITGLEQIPYLTNETIFTLKEKPQHLIIIGGGPIGCELAQAYARLGCQVTIIELQHLLAHDDPQAADYVTKSLKTDGVIVYAPCDIEQITPINENTFSINLNSQGSSAELTGTHLLVATGRQANTQGLKLAHAQVKTDKRGAIIVNKRLQTSNKRIYAIGDVIGHYQFTHTAGYHASLLIRHLFFRLPINYQQRIIPWVTYTDPELAHVGISTDVKKLPAHHQITSQSFAENDRARTEHATNGLIKVVTTSRGRIKGVTIVGRHAGELIMPWVLAMEQGLSLRHMADCIVPYPTLSEINKKVAGNFFAPMLFSDKTKWIVKLLKRC